MDREEKAGLIVCSPEMYNYFKETSGDKLPPSSTFVITALLNPNVAFVVTQDDFTDFLEEKGQMWGR